MPRTVADRIGIGIYEAAKLNRARGRCLAPIVAGASRRPGAMSLRLSRENAAPRPTYPAERSRPAQPQSYLTAFPGSTTPPRRHESA